MSKVEIAADAGDPDALYELGNRHAYGSGGVRINIRKALELWMAAALQGHAGALYRIGVCYSLGTCVPRNTGTALQMWLKAAADGCADAMHTLGRCHQHGEGVPQSNPLALMWLLLASTHAHPEAEAALKELDATLTDDDRELGIRLMAEWLQKPK